MSEEEQIHDVGREGAPDAKAPETAEPDELRVPDDLEKYFDRVEAEKGERAAAEAAIAEAERMAREQGDRSMHVADSSRETVNGALSRLGGDLSQGKDAVAALDGVKQEIVRLKTKERAALVALRNELAPPELARAPVADERKPREAILNDTDPAYRPGAVYQFEGGAKRAEAEARQEISDGATEQLRNRERDAAHAVERLAGQIADSRGNYPKETERRRNELAHEKWMANELNAELSERLAAELASAPDGEAADRLREELDQRSRPRFESTKNLVAQASDLEKILSGEKNRPTAAHEKELRTGLALIRRELDRRDQADRRPAAPENPAASPSDSWSSDERRDVSAYLDSVDATDKAHAAYMKSVREMKKIDKGSDEWSQKAGEVNGLEKAWKDAKAASRGLEDKLGPRAGELTALDVGRKAGRDALRERLNATVETPSAMKTTEPEPKETVVNNQASMPPNESSGFTPP